MNYFENLSKWISIPIKESGLEIATIKLDQLVDLNLENVKAGKLMFGYSLHWIYSIFEKIQFKKSIMGQSEIAEDYSIKMIENFRKLEQTLVTYDNNSFDYLVAFSSKQGKPSDNAFIKKLIQLSVTKNLTVEHPFLYTNALANWQKQINSTTYSIIFQIPYTGRYQYEQNEAEYFNNLLAHLENHTAQKHNKKFLFAFEFLKDLSESNKKQFFRSFIRSMLMNNLFYDKIDFENIFIYLESKKDEKIFNKALIELTQLFKYHSIENEYITWEDFWKYHPYRYENKLPVKIRNDKFQSANRKEHFKEYFPVEQIKLPDTIQGRVKTKSPVFQKFLSHINIAAESEINILLLGETGVGKGELVKQIHLTSSRKDKPFISVNCAAIPDTLIESELFGHVKGAFTGAMKDKKGKIEAADGGILFLDEIANAPLTVQQKILTFIQSKKFYPVGSEADEKEVDVRIFFATNKKPEELVSGGQMLDDFYYRIIEPNYTVPALRERAEDIPEFINYFIQVYQTKIKWQLKPTPDAKSRMCELNWPGNIRQLENAILKLFLNCKARRVNEFNAEDVNEVISEPVSFDHKSIIKNYEISYNKLFDNYLMRRDQLKKIEYDRENQTTKLYQKQNQHSFLKLIIEPIAANHYKTLSLNKIDASKVLGLDGNNGENSLLDQKALLYYKIKEYFK